MAYLECKFYIEGGKCSHIDTPNPRHSWCIGKDECKSWDDEITQQITRYQAQLNRIRTTGPQR